MMDNFTLDNETSTKPDEASVTKRERLQAAYIANELLKRGGWSGVQLRVLERVVDEQDEGPDLLNFMEKMRDARDREDALKP